MESSYFRATDDWHTVHTGAIAAVLAVSGVANPSDHPAVDEARVRLEVELRERFGTMDLPALRATHPISAYDQYYRRFGQTYHVQHQIESVAIKGKPIPRRAALVEAMFMAELETQLLTAGHDLDRLNLPVTVDIAKAGDAIGLLSGSTKEPPLNDMLMRDGEGSISSVTVGPDSRTQITPKTTSVLFAIYAPVGVGEELVRTHLTTLDRNVKLISPEATTIASELIVAGA